VERWPPAYDADDLKKMIGEIAGRDDLRKAIYAPSLTEGGPLCQGDVLRFSSPAPVIDAGGASVALGDFGFWLVIGNTCDFHRPIESVAWTQVVPLVQFTKGVNEQHLEDLTKYRASRVFYTPYWREAEIEPIFAAELVRPVALHKKVIGQQATVVARMSRLGWMLLHACLVRFLARDDGRFD
jgi:hypothetical protein